MPDDLPQVILTLLIAFIILFVGTITASSIVDTTSDTNDVTGEPVKITGTQWATISDTVGTNERVYNSLGNGVNTTGATDSYYQTSSTIDIATDDTWSVSIWVAVHSGATARNMTVLSINGRVIISYNGSTGNYTAWYYEDGSRNSYELSANAASPTSLTNLQLIRNQSTLTLYTNASEADNTTLSGSSSVAAPVNNTNCDCLSDELRTSDTAFNSSQRSHVYNNPVAPLPSADRTARVMFDEPGTNTQLLFFSSGKVNLYNASIVAALPGEELEGKSIYNDVTGKTDYKWDTTGPRVRAVAGGQVDGAPVVYVSYKKFGPTGRLVQDWTAAMGLAGVLFVVLPLGVVIMYIRSSRQGR